MKIAIIGSGVSGMLAARLLHSEHDVTVLESGSYAGGHTQTLDLDVGGRAYPVDTGFMVYNDRTYPNFSRMLGMLGIESRFSDMSFSVRSEATGLEYNGGSLAGLFAQPLNLLRPSFHGMLRDVLRFNRRSLELLEGDDETVTLADYLRENRYGRAFVEHYLVPMGASIWSSSPEVFRTFPARYVVGFFRNHGLLELRNRPQWKTIAGGAARYAEALLRPLAGRVRLSSPVVRVERFPDRVMVTTRGGVAERFDAVVIAAHADQARDMLADPSPEEWGILGAFPYEANDIVLHTDASIMPRSRRAWASWNYHLPAEPGRRVALTYDLSRLQGHDSPGPILETLNHGGAVDPGKVLRRFTFHHPLFSVGAIQAQRRYDEINGHRRTFYCGAYWGHGFHEDGVRSALAVARCFGIGLEACKVTSTRERSAIGDSARSSTSSLTACA